MVKLSERKELTEHKPIQKAGLPKKAFIPLVQHFGKPCDNTLVKPNDFVKTGQDIATSEGGLFSPVHSSISGKVIAISDCPHPSLGRAKAVIIESDGKDEKSYDSDSGKNKIENYSAEEIRSIVFNSG
ncbi:MAG: electron transporter RnfC, partial [Candidatus Omnitrophica bacterium]|nr:electron transporter RnfC [Candidatus Omnitrophota bacterium]